MLVETSPARPAPSAAIGTRYRVPRTPRPVAAASVLTLPGVWSIARVKAREEKAVADRLDRAGVATYLPLVTVVHRRLRKGRNGRPEVRRERIEVAAFPTYLFAACDGPRAVNALYDARDVYQVMPVNDQARLVRELDQVQRALTVNAELRTSDWIRKGRPARVTCGPFENFVGEVHSRLGHRVFLIGIQVLGQGVELEVADHELEAA